MLSITSSSKIATQESSIFVLRSFVEKISSTRFFLIYPQASFPKDFFVGFNDLSCVKTNTYKIKTQYKVLPENLKIDNFFKSNILFKSVVRVISQPLFFGIFQLNFSCNDSTVNNENSNFCIFWRGPDMKQIQAIS